VISFKIKNNSNELATNIALTISGPLMDEQRNETISSIAPGASTFARAFIPSLPSGGSGTTDFSIKAAMDDETYDWKVSVERIPPDWRRIHLTTHFHYDTVWIHKDGQRGYALVALDLVKQYINAARVDPTYSFVLEQIPYLKPYWDTYPEDRATLRDLISRKQLELVGGSYIQPDESSVFGEGLIRNLYYGKLYMDSVMKGGGATAAWQIDNFGHTPQLPQILRKSGFDSFTFLRGGPIGFPRQFFWMAPDGSEIISFDLDMKEDIGKVLTGRVELEKREDANMELFELMEREVLPDTFVALRNIHSAKSFFLPIGDDFMPPVTMLGMLTRYWNAKYIYPTLRFSLPSAYFNDVAVQLKDDKLNQRFTTKDLNPVFTGCYSSRTDLKIANREAETTFLDAEYLSTVANLLGAKYPARALDKALRELMYNEHHDSIPGTTNELSYLDILYGWRESLSLSKEARDNAMNFIASSIDVSAPEGEDILVVFNTLSFPRTDIVEIAVSSPLSSLKTVDGPEVPFDVFPSNGAYKLRFTAKDIPAFGYAAFRATRGGAESTLSSSKDAVSIENEFYSVEVDPKRGGGIVGLMDKATGANRASESSGALMNSIVVYEDKGDLWRINIPEDSEKLLTTSSPADVSVINGKTFSRIESKSDHGAFSLVLQIDMQKGVPRIDFTTYVHNFHGENKLFKLIFPVSGHEGLTPVYGERFAPLSRKRGEEFPADMWAGWSRSFNLRAGGKSAPLGVPAIVVNRDEPEAQQFLKKLSLALSKRGTPSVSFFESQETDLTTDSVIYIGDPETFEPLIDKLGFNLNSALHIVNRRGMAVLFDGDRPVWIIGKRIYSDPEATENLLNGILSENGAVFSDDMLLSSIPDFASKPNTFALINNGSNGYRFESDGSIALQLLRSATGRPGGEAFSRTFSKEDWNHRFRYAVATGEGDFETRNTEQTALGFNRPLLAVFKPAASSAKAVLPASSASFFGVEPKSIIVSAVKISDNSIPVYSRSDKQPSLAIRTYNNSHSDSALKLFSRFSFKSAHLADMRENKTGKLPNDNNIVSYAMKPRAIDTFILDVDLPSGNNAVIGREIEPVQPVYSAYWRHNDNVAPLGYQPLTVSFDPVSADIASSPITAKLKVASSYTDASVKGNIELRAPDGWNVNPSSISYDLGPGSFLIRDIAVTPAESSEGGIVRALYTDEGQRFYASLRVGEVGKPTLSAPESIVIKPGEEKNVEIKILNPSSQKIFGEAVVVSPIGTWVESPSTLQLSLSPFRTSFEVAALEESVLSVNIKADKNAFSGSYWFVIKLMSDGDYIYSNPVSISIMK
jgi:alpha-mannosidase